MDSESIAISSTKIYFAAKTSSVFAVFSEIDVSVVIKVDFVGGENNTDCFEREQIKNKSKKIKRIGLQCFCFIRFSKRRYNKTE